MHLRSRSRRIRSPDTRTAYCSSFVAAAAAAAAAARADGPPSARRARSGSAPAAVRRLERPVFATDSGPRSWASRPPRWATGMPGAVAAAEGAGRGAATARWRSSAVWRLVRMGRAEAWTAGHAGCCGT